MAPNRFDEGNAVLARQYEDVGDGLLDIVPCRLVRTGMPCCQYVAHQGLTNVCLGGQNSDGKIRQHGAEASLTRLAQEHFCGGNRRGVDIF